MSIERARKALKGEKTDRIPIWDIPYHAGFVKHYTGIDPVGDRCRPAIVAAMRKLDVDVGMGWVPPSLAQSPEDVEGWRNESTTLKDIFSYDPFKRSDIAGMSEADSFKQALKEYEDDVKMYGDFAMPVGRTFTTLIHYAAEDLDWVEFLSASVEEEDKVGFLLDRFEACSRKNIGAWLKTGIEIMVTHDDIAMNRGTITSPKWLRKNIFPRYERLFKMIKDTGRIHIFMTDGDYKAVAEDLAALGPDGYFIDPPCVDPVWLSNVVGKDKIIFTGPAAALFMTGTPGQMRDEVKRMADAAKAEIPRFFFHALGQIMVPGVPTENVVAYYDAVLEFGQR
ncbi:uroporphyrinogen decarboxylase family protein [Kamptonema cortianum]|nr:uroporphyrinogen decarboxylase family protein [Oscillatoria laete-virens]MDK3159945.1 uroporphyrinogen decarboxylase family protein [Kamptonema cortianum]MDL5047168.1 uroporphyrinogen decarboxylase family protein [Oscillatoria amoena NRMC-F 0135]MDL5055499.1 uroporphyrinogen decarboxylase family protein [Oscillatoria laete-virens NRMC-F 0139]